ncbi:MAG: M23 family metallopeptidase [Saprospiraceae bacterium]|nr:M23 family metallopeptidase [Saprospiraceae bacterium]
MKYLEKGKYSIFKTFLLIFLIGIFSCAFSDKKSNNIEIAETIIQDSISDSLTLIMFYDSLFSENSMYISDGFDFPVGPPDAKGYYNANKFDFLGHLGEDWNGVKGGNSDLGDPIYAISNGYIVFSEDCGLGWGNVVRIVHKLKDTTNFNFVESVYAHLDSVYIKNKTFIKRGDQIGTMGNCNGTYYAHLHFELRSDITMDLGGGYSDNNIGFLYPTEFIKKNRPK